MPYRALSSQLLPYPALLCRCCWPVLPYHVLALPCPGPCRALSLPPASCRCPSADLTRPSTDVTPLTARSVEPPPPLPDLYVVPEGRPFQLTCLPPEGRPPPAVWWETPAGAMLDKPRKVRGQRWGRWGGGGEGRVRLSSALMLSSTEVLSLFSWFS